ncbi:MAG: hypothetical protein PHQ53_00505 [Candidatus Krumholzibacteria bacterium]|nr:hypothetical protein [Candidatus Krumholzibacteria bacterium]
MAANTPESNRVPLNRRWRWSGWLWALPVAALIAAQIRPVFGQCERAVLATLDGVDALMQSGLVAWSATTWWQPAIWVGLPIFYPTPNAIVCMDSLLGQALLVAPLRLFGDPSPALLYNLACLATLVLVAVATALLWHGSGAGRERATGAAGAALCALFLLGSPFTTWQLGMLNQISPPCVVLLLVCLWLGWRRFDRHGGAGLWWWAAAACLAIQAAWGWYGFADAFFVLAVAGVAGTWAAWRRRRVRTLVRQVLAPVLLASALVLAMAWPYLTQRSSESEFTRGEQEVSYYSATLQMIGNPGPHRATWRDLWGGGELAAERARRNVDAVLHPGWVALACAAIGVWRWRRMSPAVRRFGLLLAAIGVVGIVMAFGDSGGLPPGTANRLKLPFGYLRDLVTPFQAFRAPVRFVYLGAIALAWWAAVGACSVAEPLKPRSRRLLLGGLTLALWLESVPMGLLAVPVRVDGRPGSQPLPARVPAGAVLTLPAPATEQDEDATEVLWLHRALATGRPVTGGVSGWVPPQTERLRALLAACEAGCADPLVVLADLRAQGIAGVEMAVAGADSVRVAYWDSVLSEAGYRSFATVPGYLFYLAAD